MRLCDDPCRTLVPIAARCRNCRAGPGGPNIAPEPPQVPRCTLAPLPKDHSVLALDRIEEPSPWVVTRAGCSVLWRFGMLFFPSFVCLLVRGSALLRLPGASLLVRSFSVCLLQFLSSFIICFAACVSSVILDGGGVVCRRVDQEVVGVPAAKSVALGK